jgi:hypothetical protein
MTNVLDDGPVAAETEDDAPSDGGHGWEWTPRRIALIVGIGAVVALELRARSRHARLAAEYAVGAWFRSEDERLSRDARTLALGRVLKLATHS